MTRGPGGRLQFERCFLTRRRGGAEENAENAFWGWAATDTVSLAISATKSMACPHGTLLRRAKQHRARVDVVDLAICLEPSLDHLREIAKRKVVGLPMQGCAQGWKVVQKSIVSLNDLGASRPEFGFGRSS